MNKKTFIFLALAFSLAHAAQGQLANISTRGHVGKDQQVLIAGFILDQPATVIIRGLGPSLETSGVTDTLANPVLALYDMTGATPQLLWSNDDWQDVTEPFGALAPAFPKESAIYIQLPAGKYTAILGGISGTEGMALVEVYLIQ